MKKRLGVIPKGLEWLSEQQDSVSSMVMSQDGMKDNRTVSAAKQGLSEELIRATFILKQEYLEKIKAHAYWERLQIKDVFDLMCEQFFKDKKIRAIPGKRK